MRRLRAALLAVAVALPAAAQEAPRVFVRPGIHEDFVRVAFNWPRRVAYTVERDGDTVEIRFAQPGRLDLAALTRRLPRNIETVEALPDGLRLRLRPGAEIRHMLVGEVVALDILDDAPRRARPPARPAQPASEEAALRPAPPRPVEVPVAPAPPAVTPIPAPAAAPVPVPPATPVPETPRSAISSVPQPVATPAVRPETMPTAADRPAAPPQPPPSAVLPFEGGAAAFVRGNDLVLVFDRPARPDLPALRALHPAFAEAEILEVPGATALRLSGASSLGLASEAGRWVLGPARPVPSVDVTRGSGDPPRLLFSAAGSSRALALPDPASSDLLLVGTVTSNAMTEAGFRLGAVELLPTRLGVVLVRRSESAELRRTEAGFAVPQPPVEVSASPGAEIGAAAGVRRVMSLEDLPVSDLSTRLRDLAARVVAAAPGVRPGLRLDMAETQLALGLGVEAQATAQAAVQEDPRLARQPRAILLQGAAAHMAGRASEAEPFLSDARLPADGEAALWRGLAGTNTSGLREAAPLLLAYPATLRARLAPRVVLAMTDAGHVGEARALATQLPELDRTGIGRFAQARLSEAVGDRAAADAAYAALERDRDGLARSMAMERRTELRLASGAIGHGQAAREMERAALAWRGDGRELATRLRAVELRLRAGEPGMALAGLRDARALFPEAVPQLEERERQAVLAAILHEATPAPEAARLLAEQRGALPQDPRLGAALRRIADELLRQGMAEEATRLLERGIDTSAPEQRATLTLQLAEARLADGDPQGALADLRRGDGAGALPGDAGLRRAFLEAEARRRTGDVAGATGVLRALGPDGSARLAELLAEAQDWRGAAEALGQHLATTAGSTGALPAAARRDLLRLAAFHALAEDGAALQDLRRRYGARIGDANVTAAFEAITAEVSAPRDAASLRREVARARAIADGLRAVQ